MTPYGIGLVARQEIRTRLRTGRWKLLMAVWFIVVNGLGLLFRMALEYEGGVGSHGAVPMFGGVLLGVLVLTLMIAPALGAQSINGERERGTLAGLQITRLAPGDIVLGKLAAGWGTGALVLLLAMPSALIPVLEGEIGIGRAVIAIGVTALLIGIVCALSLGWSGLVARSITSVLLSYLTVFGLLVGTVLAFALATPLTTAPTLDDDYVYYEENTQYIWWLLAPNPVVVLADAAPRIQERVQSVADHANGDDIVQDHPIDPLGEVGDAVRDARSGETSGSTSGSTSDRDEAGAVWTYGLAFDLALAGGALWVATRRLRTPMRTVAKGVRIA